MKNPTQTLQTEKVRFFFKISAIEGVLCALVLAVLPVGSGSGSSFNFSLSKSLLILFCLILTLMLWLMSRSTNRTQLITEQLRRSVRLRFLIPVLAILFIAAIGFSLRVIWLLYQTTGIFRYKVLSQRVLPLSAWLALIAFQLLMLAVGLNGGWKKVRAPVSKKQLRFFAILTTLVAVIAGLVTVTRVGLEKDNAFFGKPTVPLLEWHIALAIIVMILCQLNRLRIRGSELGNRLIKWLPLIIWLAAAAIWLGIPNQHGFFSPAGRAPNFETYPFSDGSFYGHYARSVAAGMGYKGTDIPPRPLYILFLALFHLIGGNNYDSVILIQTLVLALLPVMLYLIGKELSSVLAGLGAAIAYILRETNAILSAPFAHNVSTTKYFFSDLPTALTAMFFLWSLIRWLKTLREGSQKARLYAVACGGGLGLMTLIRTQSLVLILIPLFTILLYRSIRTPEKTKQLALFLITLLCCLLPWLMRNQTITGKMVMDHPATQTAEMVASYNIGKLDMARDPGMNDGDYSAKLTGVLWESIRNHPMEIGRFITAHFFNNLISAFRVFPIRDSLASAQELLRPTTAFWEMLDNIQLRGLPLAAFLLAVLVVCWGTSASCRKFDRIGMLPMIAFLLFNLSTAIGRYSAGRYLIPMDWALFVCFFIGIDDWLEVILTWSRNLPEKSNLPKTGVQPVLDKSQRGSWSVLMIVFLLAGLAVPVVPTLIPMQFQPATQAEIIEKLSLSPTESSADNALLTKAIALYPRYYAAGEGEPESAKQGYGVEPYGRLIFLIISPEHFGTIELPLAEAPAHFPDNATVWLAGHGQGATSIADWVLVEDGDNSVLYESVPLDLSASSEVP